MFQAGRSSGLSESAFHLKQVSAYFMSLGRRWDLENPQLSHESEKHETLERKVMCPKNLVIRIKVMYFYKHIETKIKIFSEQEMANGN